MLSDLFIVTAISNPCRYRSRYDLYRQFAKRVADSGARLITVEAAFGGRPYEVTTAGSPDHVQLRTNSELWHKENLLNIGIRHLPHDWEYVAWVDADLTFQRPDWVVETVQQLQHYAVVQMFSQAQDLSPQHEPFQRHRGFCWSYETAQQKGKSYEFWHPGFAWAARRDAIEHLGGLIDWAILGAADHHMACALVGDVLRSLDGRLKGAYRDSLLQWQDRADRYIRRNIGHVDGLITHHWHGRNRDRRYIDRWQALVRNGFDPALDLKRDWQGLYQLTDRSIGLRDDIRRYFRQRNEDSIDFDQTEQHF